MKKHHRKKYPRHCCKFCDTMHRTYRGAEAHKRELIGELAQRRYKRITRDHAKRAKPTGFAAMPMKKRVAIARKGGRASARARGYR